MPYKTGKLKGQLTTAEIRKLIRGHNKLVNIKVPTGIDRDGLIAFLKRKNFEIDHENQKLVDKAERRGKSISLETAKSITKPVAKTELQKQKTQERKEAREAKKKKEAREIKKEAIKEEKARSKPKAKPKPKTATIQTQTDEPKPKKQPKKKLLAIEDKPKGKVKAAVEKIEKKEEKKPAKRADKGFKVERFERTQKLNELAKIMKKRIINPYKVLGIKASEETPELVKKRCKELRLTEHPDKGGDPEKFDLIQNVCRILLDTQTIITKKNDKEKSEALKKLDKDIFKDFDFFHKFAGKFFNMVDNEFSGDLDKVKENLTGKKYDEFIGDKPIAGFEEYYKGMNSQEIKSFHQKIKPEVIKYSRIAFSKERVKRKSVAKQKEIQKKQKESLANRLSGKDTFKMKDKEYDFPSFVEWAKNQGYKWSVTQLKDFNEMLNNKNRKVVSVRTYYKSNGVLVIVPTFKIIDKEGKEKEAELTNLTTQSIFKTELKPSEKKEYTPEEKKAFIKSQILFFKKDTAELERLKKSDEKLENDEHKKIKSMEQGTPNFGFNIVNVSEPYIYQENLSQKQKDYIKSKMDLYKMMSERHKIWRNRIKSNTNIIKRLEKQL